MAQLWQNYRAQLGLIDPIPLTLLQVIEKETMREDLDALRREVTYSDIPPPRIGNGS